jgi:hypothetical protein
MDEARRHFQEALNAIKGEVATKPPEDPTLPKSNSSPPPSSE